MPTRQAATKVMEITLAHSPDSDDAFMFYALATRKVRTPGMRFTHVLADIETLNQAAPEELYDVTALSFPAYAFLRDKYVLLDCGASFGEGYGPILVASHPMKREELAGRRVAVLNYAMQFARDMDIELADKFVGMYVNNWTLGYGERGRRAVGELLARGAQAGLLPRAEVGAPLEFLSAEE